MSIQTSKMELTPMDVSFQLPSDLAPVNLGGTLGNCVVHVEYVKGEIKADQSGETVRDRRVSGLNISVVTELTQIKDKGIWKKVFPHAELITDGLGNQQLYFQNSIGDSDLARAGILTLHPRSLAAADKSGDFKFFKACADAKSEITYGPKDQARLKITWNILPDDSVLPERFCVHGDPSIGLNAAVIAAAVAGGGNVGNGTVGTVSAGLKTVTEVITLTAITPTVFAVSGSLSGALGEATTGVGFTSAVVNFLITVGGTPFAAGDSFTMAATGANYV